MRELDNFEKYIKQQLEAQHHAFREEDWVDLEKRLDQIPPKAEVKTPKTTHQLGSWLITAIAACIASVAFTTIVSLTENKGITNQTQSKHRTQQHVPLKSTAKSSIELNAISIEHQAEPAIQTELTVSASNYSNLNHNNTPVSGNLPFEKSSTNSSADHVLPAAPAAQVGNNSMPGINTATTKQEVIQADSRFNPYEAASPNFSASKKKICIGETVQFSMDISRKDVKVIWHFGDGTTSTQLQPSHTYTKTGFYNVVLEVLTVNGNPSESNMPRYIEVVEKPDVHMVIQEQFSAKWELPVVTARLDGYCKSCQYSWELDGKKIGQGREVNFTALKAKSYDLKLNAKSSTCSIDLQNTYTQFEDYSLLAPDAFSPNGDGTNDTWFPKALLHRSVSFKLVIKSIDGQLVYETNVPQEWDGRSQNSNKKAKSGERYIWSVSLQNELGQQETYSGVILIK